MNEEQAAELCKHLDVINAVQSDMWEKHHRVKAINETLANYIWECSLQIEHALGQINQKLLGKPGYYDPASQSKDGE